MTDDQRPTNPDDEVEGRLRRSFDTAVPPPAPDTIFDAVARLSTSDASPRSRWMPAVIVLAAAVVVVGAAVVMGSRPRPSDLASASPTPPAGSPSEIAATGLPVDTSIEPVSLSHPSPEAAEALRICQVNEGIGADQVSGMGRIPHARDAFRYVPLTGLEPEIQTDAPAWIVTFTGEVPMPKSGEIWIDPTCIVVGGGGGMYATGPVEITSSHVTVTPPPGNQQPDLALPPPLP
jgi:hypothetical protein